MVGIKFWRTHKDQILSDGWHGRVRFWRVQVHVQVLCHRYPTTSDRWVPQSQIAYDRRPDA